MFDILSLRFTILLLLIHSSIGFYHHPVEQSEEEPQYRVHDDGTKVKFVSFNGLTNISLVCRIPPGQYYVVWEKLQEHGNTPLLIGEERFIKDDRFSVVHRPPDRWTLVIRNVKVPDSGLYTCSTTNGNKGPTPGFENEPEDNFGLPTIKPSKISFNVTILDDGPEESKVKYSSQVINDQRYLEKIPTKIKLYGPKLVVYNSALMLKCEVTFNTNAISQYDFKFSSRNPIEWYHNGHRIHSSSGKHRYKVVRQVSSEKLISSTLRIDQVLPEDSGNWICLQRAERQLNEIIDIIAFEKLTLEVVVPLYSNIFKRDERASLDPVETAYLRVNNSCHDSFLVNYPFLLSSSFVIFIFFISFF